MVLPKSCARAATFLLVPSWHTTTVPQCTNEQAMQQAKRGNTHHTKIHLHWTVVSLPGSNYTLNSLRLGSRHAQISLDTVTNKPISGAWDSLLFYMPNRIL